MPRALPNNTQLKVRGDKRPATPRRLKALEPSTVEQDAMWEGWFPHCPLNLDTQPEEVEILLAAFIKFCNQALVIRHPSKGRVPLELRPAQVEVARLWLTHRKTVALKARQIGFSTLASAFVLWLTMGWGDRHVVLLSRTERESVKLMSKIKYNYRFMPQWAVDRGPKLLDRTKQTMTWDNESAIESLPSANDPARGESVFLVIVDEWAFLPNPDEAWASIEPIADIGGRIIGISTARGEGNFFHHLWLGSQTQSNGFHGIFFPWWAVTERDDDWYETKKNTLPSWQLYQEYPSNPEEAFQGSGNPVFNLDRLREMSAYPPEAKLHVEGSRRSELIVVEGGSLLVWEPPQKHKTYCIGADIAEGLEHGDFTVAWILEVQTGHPVAVYRAHIDPDIFGEKILPAIGWYYNYALLAPEVNNHGLTVLKALQRVGYSRLYRRRTFHKRYDSVSGETVGWMTTSVSKPLMIDELAAWLRTYTVPHDVTLAELKTFTRDERGRMSGSPHDDCVMSLAMAVQARKYAFETAPNSGVDKLVKGSIAWLDAQLQKRGTERSTIRPTL